jgi:hypothetical protein
VGIGAAEDSGLGMVYINKSSSLDGTEGGIEKNDRFS